MRPCKPLSVAVLSWVLGLTGCTHEDSSPVLLTPSDDLARGIEWSHSKAIEVSLTEFSFSPDLIILQKRQAYDLHVSNKGSVSHTLTAPAFFRSVAYSDEGATRQLLQSTGSIALSPGETFDVSLAPLEQGHFPMECSKPLHAVFGMHGEIDVQESSASKQ